jgi:hypothetical protein
LRRNKEKLRYPGTSMELKDSRFSETASSAIIGADDEIHQGDVDRHTVSAWH